MGNLLFTYPKLKDKCVIREEEDNFIFRYEEEEFVVEIANKEDLNVIRNFLGLLDGNHTAQDIQRSMGNKTLDEVLEYLEQLDGCSLLTEGKRKHFDGSSGLEFILECEDYVRKWERQLGEAPFATILHDGLATKNQILGFSIEYYHVTYRAHDCISPALTKAHSMLRKGKLREFFIEEYRHDKLLMNSLKSVGFTEEEIISSVPLPRTVALCNLLSNFAHNDPLSFMASLFVFEGTELDNVEYIESLKKCGAPEKLIQHQAIHSDINHDGDHGAVSRDFFSTIEYVGEEDRKRVLKNLRLVLETYWKLSKDIAEYYGNPSISIPRTLLKGELVR